MKEILRKSNYKGVFYMKKTLLVAALVAVLVVAFASTAFAYGPIFNGGAATSTGFTNYNSYTGSPAAVWTTAQGGGYLSWALGQTYSADNATSPHGNYATTTNKCAVCHAVHRADSAGTVLTAWDGNGPASGDMMATASCLFCHGPSATFTSVRIVAEHAGEFTLSPHGRCQRCHTTSPHGAGASEYPVLTQKLLNTEADAAIATDLLDVNINNLTADMFDLSDPAKVQSGVTMGTGYLCSACHENDADPVVFAINKTEALPTIAGKGSASAVTGHRALAMNTDTWNQAGEYGAYYSGIQNADGTLGTSTVAFNPVSGCKSCHDATGPDGQAAFPHGYVNGDGNAVAKSETSAAVIWMTVADDADGTKSVASHQNLGATKTEVLTSDGLCLKCHLSGDKTAGVGVTY